MKDNNNSAVESQQSDGVAMGTIYKITCLINGKPYVGQTRQPLRKRIYKHISASKSGRPGIDAAIAKYGWESFTVKVLKVCPVEMLNEREMYWIKKLNSKAPNGYNLTDGGDGCIGYKHTAESLAKISATSKGRPSWNKGNKMSDEQKAKISASEKGRPAWNKGKKMSDEARARMSASKSGEKHPMFGKHHSDETRAKMSAAQKGKPSPSKGKKRSPEACARMSIAQQASWARRKKAIENGGES